GTWPRYRKEGRATRSKAEKTVTALQILIDILLGYAPLNAALSGRVYPVTAPQKPTLPYIAVNRFWQDEGETLTGPDGMLDARLSVAVVASTAGDADLL